MTVLVAPVSTIPQVSCVTNRASALSGISGVLRLLTGVGNTGRPAAFEQVGTLGGSRLVLCPRQKRKMRWRADSLDLGNCDRGCWYRNFCSILCTRAFTPRLVPLLPLIWFLIFSRISLMLFSGTCGLGVFSEPVMKKTDCTHGGSVDKMSLALVEGISGKSRNSAGMA